MIPNPILKVLSTLSSHGVRHLLMGGQACVFYGAAEFSRDCDIVIVTDQANLDRMSVALGEIDAECIAVPLLDWRHLDRGHALHFRCHHPDTVGIRLDVMAKMRGCPSFADMWEQRTSVQDEAGFVYELLGIEDLIQAKKTQSDRDWPMIRRLVEAHFDQNQDHPTPDQIRFWLRELRSPETLIRVAAAYPEPAALRVLMRRNFIGRGILATNASLNKNQSRAGQLQVPPYSADG